MTFNQLLDAVRANPDSVSIPPSWAQGRAAFGGLMAAMVYETMRLKIDQRQPPGTLIGHQLRGTRGGGCAHPLRGGGFARRQGG